jgi:uncharacterized protein
VPPYVLLVPGYADAGPEHWQAWLAVMLANRGSMVDMPRFSDPDRPQLYVWLTELREHLALAPRDVERIVVAHSCGSTLWLHHAARLTDTHEDRLLRFDRALLVAPPAPGRHFSDLVGFEPVPADPAGIRRAAGSTRLVVGEQDPYCTAGEARAYAGALEIDLDVIPGGRHLNTASGYGPWPSVLEWVNTGLVPITAWDARS